MNNPATSAMPWLLALLAVLGIVALIVLIVVLVRAAKAMKGVNELVENANKEVTPALENINAMVSDAAPCVKALAPAIEKVDPLVDRVQLTVDTVNLELLRVDGILEDVEQVTDVAGSAATTVNTSSLHLARQSPGCWTTSRALWTRPAARRLQRARSALSTRLAKARKSNNSLSLRISGRI